MINNTLKLTKSLFTKASLERTIEDFSALVRVTYEQDEAYYICTFQECRYELEMTKREFENYLLGILYQMDSMKR